MTELDQIAAFGKLIERADSYEIPLTELDRFIEWVDSFETIAKASAALGIVQNYIFKLKSGERAINDSVRWKWLQAGGEPDAFDVAAAPQAVEQV